MTNCNLLNIRNVVVKSESEWWWMVEIYAINYLKEAEENWFFDRLECRADDNVVSKWMENVCHGLGAPPA